MNSVQFPTRIRHLCRKRAHINWPCISNINSRGAGSVVVSASDCHVGGPSLIPRRCKSVIVEIKINSLTLTLLNWCNAMRHAHWHDSYIKRTVGLPMCVPTG